MKLLLKLKNFLPVGVIFAMWAIVAATNYTPNTILSGWDNLHPEFNLVLNIKRSLNVFWQEYQGVGLLGGMGHAADLVRQLIFVPLSLFVPMLAMRYVWTFAMLLIGPVGVYFLLKRFTENKTASLAGAVFYLFNLATIQYFYNPFETFVGFYGFLPWLTLGGIKYLSAGGKKNMHTFALISLFATPAFYVQTMFLVWMSVFGVFSLEAIAKKGKTGLKRFLVSLAIIFVTNSFWLVPSTYFTFKNSDVVSSSKQNVFATEETALMNQAFGSISNIAQLKGYWFEYTDTNNDSSKFIYLYEPWREHTERIAAKLVSYALFIVSLIGVLLWAIKEKGKFRFSPLLMFLMGIFLLSGGSGIASLPFNFLKDNVPLFGQVFRSVFTKWSVFTALFYSMGLGFFVAIIAKLLLKTRLKLLSFILFLIILLGSLYVSAPAFKGNLVADSMQLSMPKEYFELFDYFKKEPKEKRISFMPVQSVWGWNFFSWGYRGSGFLWYGIEQPILDRAFDVWSRDNEEYYQEIRTAVYTEDLDLFKSVLQKYDISYVILDESVVIPEQDSSLLRYDQIKKMLTDSGAEVSWSKKHLSVYKTPNATEGFLYDLKEYSNANTNANYLRIDDIYKKAGNYVSKGNYYPFYDLLEEKVDVGYEADLSGQYAVFGETITPSSDNVVIPAFDSTKKYTFKAKALYDNGVFTLNIYNPYEILLDGKKASIDIFEDEIFINYESSYPKLVVLVNDLTFEIAEGEQKDVFFSSYINSPLNVEVYNGTLQDDVIGEDVFEASAINNCWQREGSVGKIDTNFKDGILNIETSDAVGCTAYKLGDLPNGRYLLNFVLPYKSDTGARPYYCIQEEGAPECINRDIFYITKTSEEWVMPNYYHILDGNKSYWSVIGGRPPEEAGKSWDIDYKKPVAYFYPLLTSAQFDAKMWEGLTIERTISLPSGSQELKVRVPIHYETLDLAHGGRPDAFNCDIFKRGTVEKNISAGSKVQYVADGYGGICDFITLQSDLSDQDYLLHFSGENKQGRGIKFYLYNNTKKYPELEGILAGGNFSETYSLLSQYHDKKTSDYILNTGVQSFLDPAISTLNPVLIYAAPLSVISEIKLTSGDMQKLEGDIQISNIKKYGTAIYTANASGEGVLALSQGYDSGWIAFSGTKKLEHVEVNSWANGWVVPTGEHSITIIYLPQILQWIGFGVLAGYLGILVYQICKR